MEFSAVLSGNEVMDIPPEHLANLKRLHEVLCNLELACDMMLHLTSGYRSRRQHIAIYKQINDTRLIQHKSEIPVPIGSKHLTGEAADILDPRGELKAWMMGPPGEAFMQMNGVWCENPDWTPSWIHCQISPPKSGKRFFRPY